MHWFDGNHIQIVLKSLKNVRDEGNKSDEDVVDVDYSNSENGENNDDLMILKFKLV